MSELVFQEGFWVRADNVEQDLVIVHDIYQQDAYRTRLLTPVAFRSSGRRRERVQRDE
jgi:hypothetical protein